MSQNPIADNLDLARQLAGVYEIPFHDPDLPWRSLNDEQKQERSLLTLRVRHALAVYSFDGEYALRECHRTASFILERSEQGFIITAEEWIRLGAAFGRLDAVMGRDSTGWVFIVAHATPRVLLSIPGWEPDSGGGGWTLREFVEAYEYQQADDA